MFRRLIAAAVILVIAAGLLVAAWPQLFGLQRVLGVAQLVSLRGAAIVVAGILVVAFTLIALVFSGARRFAASVALLLLVFVGVSLAVLATRGGGNPAFETKADGDITVLSWNTLGDAPGVQVIAQLALDQSADVVVLPETSVATAQAVADRLAAEGHPMQLLHLSLDEISKARTTSLLISTSLGDYQLDSSVGTTETLPSLVAVPVDGSGPTIVAAHPISPIPGEMSHWQQGLNWLHDRCLGSNVIAAGDFNSTLDHWAGLGGSGGSASGSASGSGAGELGNCHDAARATGNAAVGSWPTSLPALLGTPIDHVLATDGWKVVGFRVIGSEDGAGSDHRPVVAQLRPLR